MLRRIVLHLAVLTALAGVAMPARAQSPDEVIAIISDRAEAHGQSAAYLVAVATCESRLDVYAVGAAGELGLYQLAGFGLLPLFYRQGYDNPWSAWQQSDFAAGAFQAGLAHHWSCAR